MPLPENLDDITDVDELKKLLVDENKEADKWKTLSRKNEETAKANVAAVKELEELKSSGKSEAEQLREKLDAAEARAKALELKDLRKQLAADNELTAEQAEFLQGDDEPSILESIEKVKKAFPAQSETDDPFTETVTETKPKSNLYALHDTGDTGKSEQVLKAMLGETQ